MQDITVLEAASIRICKSNSEVVGAAVLVSPKYVLTCAHVVNQSLNLSDHHRDQPREQICLNFTIYEPKKILKAFVERWIPLEEDGSGDIALLELCEDLPKEARPVGLVVGKNISDHAFRVLGYPDKQDRGIWVKGTIQQRVAGGRIQLRGDGDFASRIKKGFSGGAVWDDNIKGIVGIVDSVAQSRFQNKDAFMFSTEHALEMIPDLESFNKPINPYRGLSYFREEDANVFFGRDKEIAELLEHTKRSPHIVAVVGNSGVGKSSLVKAGLIPKLRSESNWQIIQVRPNRKPFRSLARGILASFNPELANKSVEINKLSQGIESGNPSLIEVFEDNIEIDSDKKLLLVIDQFEELYTAGESNYFTDRNNAQEVIKPQVFIDQLLKAVKKLNGRITLVITLRADFLPSVLEYAPLFEIWKRAEYLVGPITKENLSVVIEKPAQDQGVPLEEGLKELILKDLLEEETSLPLLEFTLEQLWDKRKGGKLVHQAYDELGGVKEALAKHAESTYTNLTEEQQTDAKRLLLRLIDVGTSRAKDTRRTVPHKDTEELWSTASKLADARLLVIGQNESGEQFSELVHEYLIHAWKRLEDLVNENRSFLDWRKRLDPAVKQWESTNKDKGSLLRGSALIVAETWLESQKENLSKNEQNFIQNSVNQREKVKRQRRLIVISVIVTTLIVAIIMTVLGFSARQQSIAAKVARNKAIIAQETSLSRYLIAQANSNQTDLDLALLLGIKSNEIVKSSEALPTLKGFMSLVPPLKKFLHGHTKSITNVVYDSSGEIMASASTDGSIILWNMKTESILKGPLVGHNGESVKSISFNSDGTILASASGQQILFWSVSTGQLLGNHFLEPNKDISSITFSPVKNILMLGNSSGIIIVLDSAKGQIVRTTVGHSSDITDIKFSPDGRFLASSSTDGTVKIWEGNTLQMIWENHVDNHYASAVSFSPDGNTLAVGGQADHIILWDVLTGKRISNLRLDRTRQIRDLAFHPKFNILASEITGNQIGLWSTDYQSLSSNYYRGHANSINSLSFHPEGNKLVSGDGSGKIILWDWSFHHQGVKEQSLTRSDTLINATFNSNGETLVLVSGDGSINLWDIDKEEFKTFINKPNPMNRITSIDFGVDDSEVFSIDGSNIILWNLEDIPISVKNKSEQLSENIPSIGSSLVHPNKRTVVIGACFFIFEERTCKKGVILFWDSQSEKVFKEVFVENLLFIDNLAINSAGNKLAISGCKITSLEESSQCNESEIQLWNINDMNNPQVITKNVVTHKGQISDLEFSNSGTMLASSNYYGQIILWDINNQVTVGILSANQTSVKDIDFSHNDILLASVSDEGTIVLWEVDNQKALQQSDQSDKGFISRVIFSPDKKSLISTHEDGSVLFWDTESLGIINEITNPSTIPIFDIEFIDSSNKNVLIAYHDAVALSDEEGRINRVPGSSQIAKFSVDGKILATKSTNNEVFLWEAENMDPISFLAHDSGITDLVLSSDKKTVVTIGCEFYKPETQNCTQLAVKIWEVIHEPKLIFTLPIEGNSASPALAIHPLGKTIAFSSDEEGKIVLWNIAENRKITELSEHRSFVQSLAFSPDGRKMISGDINGLTTLWDLEQSSPIFYKKVSRNGSQVFDIAFSPEGDAFAVANGDGSVFLINAEDGQETAHLVGHDNIVTAIDFSADGSHLASASLDGTYIIWNLSENSIIQEACFVANRNFTFEEWQQYMGDKPYEKTCPEHPSGISE